LAKFCGGLCLSLKSQERWSKGDSQMINIRLDYVLLDRRMKLKDLAEATGLAVNNLSILKTNKARAIRLSTLNALCKALNCTPGDLIEYIPDETEEK
jgi:putative transcriptional regulator